MKIVKYYIILIILILSCEKENNISPLTPKIEPPKDTIIVDLPVITFEVARTTSMRSIYINRELKAYLMPGEIKTFELKIGENIIGWAYLGFEDEFIETYKAGDSTYICFECL